MRKRIVQKKIEIYQYKKQNKSEGNQWKYQL